MKRLVILLRVAVLLSLLLAACATPTPQIIEKIVTQTAEETVKETVVVSTETVTEVEVEVTETSAIVLPTRTLPPTPMLSIYSPHSRLIEDWLFSFRAVMEEQIGWSFEFDISYIETAETLTDDVLETIVQSTIFLDMTDMSGSCPEALELSDIAASDDTEGFLADYEGFLSELLMPVPGFDLLAVTWIDDTCGRDFTTVTVIDHNGYYLYEPILDTTITSMEQIGGSPYYSVRWYNLLGITKGWAYMWMDRKGSDGCTSEFTSKVEMGAAFPFEIDKNGSKSTTKYCSPRETCKCRHMGGKENHMECEEHSQAIVLKGQFGLSYFSATIVTYSSTLTVL